MTARLRDKSDAPNHLGQLVQTFAMCYFRLVFVQKMMMGALHRPNSWKGSTNKQITKETANGRNAVAFLSHFFSLYSQPLLLKIYGWNRDDQLSL